MSSDYNPGVPGRFNSHLPRRDFLKTLVVGGVSLPWFGRFSSARELVFPIDDPFSDDVVFPDPVDFVPETPFRAPDGSWTLAVFPDTQYYSQHYPEVFLRQTEWIVKNRDAHNILFVAHEGDIVQNNAAREWANAQAAIRVLTEAGVPYALLPGNHDLGDRGRARSRDTLMNDYFSEEDYRNSEQFILFEPGKMENSCHTLTTPTDKYLIVALEFGPRDSVLEWANTMAKQFNDHRIIVVTHCHLRWDNERYDHVAEIAETGSVLRGNPRRYRLSNVGSVNDSQQVWDKFGSRHAHIEMILSGHIVSGGGIAHLRSDGPNGSWVHEILANYQDSGRPGGTALPRRGYGGGGYMRLMRFLPDGKSIDVRSYSPWYDHWLREPGQEFVLDV